MPLYGIFKLLFYYLKSMDFNISVHCFHGLWLILDCFPMYFFYSELICRGAISGNPRCHRLTTCSSARVQAVSVSGNGRINLNVFINFLTDPGSQAEKEK